MKLLYILFLLLPFFTIAQSSKIAEQRRPLNLNKLIISKVSLAQKSDTIISFKASEIEVIDTRESDFNALGAYDDWQKNDSIAWLFFHKKVDREFEDYLNQVVTKDIEANKLKISITKFRIKQTMFSNGKRAQYLYAYEIEREINNKKYTSSIEGKVKIENVDGPKRVLDPIKVSLWELLSEKLTE